MTVAAESLSKDRLRLWLKMLKAGGAIEGELRRRLREEFDSTLPRFDVMSALARHPEGLRMSEISGLLRVSNGNVTGIVDRLTQDGLAKRVAVPSDRRAHLVTLTEAGAAAFADLAAAHERWLDAMLGGFDAGEIERLGALLDKLAGHLERRDRHAI